MQTTQIGDYRLLSLIAPSTYLAEHTQLKTLRCLTQVGNRPDLEQVVARLVDLSHPHVCSVYNFTTVDDQTYLVSDTVTDALGNVADLNRYMRDNSRIFGDDEVMALLQQVADALDFYHAHGLPHGNIKPSSILMLGNRISLTNYGVTDYVLTCSNTVPVARQELAFLSPEQKRGEKSTCACDVYAFGVLAYLSLVRFVPDGLFPMPSVLRGESDYNWDLLITQCMTPHPEERPSSLLDALDEVKSERLGPQVPLSDIEIPTGQLVKAASPVVSEPEEPRITPTRSISGGTYWRGTTDGGADEMPRHKVNLPPFAIDVHPVTNSQFALFLHHTDEEEVIVLEESRLHQTDHGVTIEPGYENHPVVGVTWHGAAAYAAWVGKRLPTEAEWEVAARAGSDTSVYPTGEKMERTLANFSSADTSQVMSYAPNLCGLYDMAGNVYEWCSDWYQESYYELSSQQPNNPRGPEEGNARVLRGGCWNGLKSDMRCSHRHRDTPTTGSATYGFRCVYDE